MLLEPMLAVVDLVTAERRTFRVIGRVLQLLLALDLLVGRRFRLIILLRLFLCHIIGVLHHGLFLFDDRGWFTFDHFLFNFEWIGLICSW